MRKSKYLALVATAAMAVTAIPAPTLYAQEPDTQEVAQTAPAEQDKQETKKVLRLKFVNSDGSELVLEDSEKKYEKNADDESIEAIEQEGYFKTEFDLKEIEGSVAIDKEKLPEGYQAEINEAENKLTVVFPEITEEKEITLVVTPVSEESDKDDQQVDEQNPVEETVADSEITVNAAGDQAADRATLTIRFVYTDSKNEVSQPCVVQLASGASFSNTWKLPTPKGYALDLEQTTTPEWLHLSVNGNVLAYEIDAIVGNTTVTLYYEPAETTYTVNVWEENIENDGYTKVSSTVKTGKKTGDTIHNDLTPAKEGFYPLVYNTNETVAADGSTVVDVYYKRHYYLMTFALDGGYGVEPIYAKYGSPISVGTPTKLGYSFVNWGEDEIPATMPAHNSSYTATWNPEKVSFTVAFWYENADDDNYSYVSQTKIENVDAGSEAKSADYKNTSFTGKDSAHFTYNSAKEETIKVNGDGTSVLNVYFTRNVYTATFTVKQGWSETQKIVKTIRKKYEQSTLEDFPIVGSDGTKYDNYQWLMDKSNKYYTAGFASMPGETKTYSGSEIYVKKHLNYYVEALPETPDNQIKTQYTYNQETKRFLLYTSYGCSYTYLTYNEDFPNIKGFNRWTSNPKFSSTTSKPNAQTNNDFYYSRKKYNITYNNGNTELTSFKREKLFEELLTSADNVTPETPPEGFDPSGWEFAGWYTTSDCIPGTEVKFDETRMPDSNLVLYAHWVEKKHTVNFYKDSTMSENHKTVENVKHGHTLEEPVENPVKENRDFLGWFYKDGDVEKAFDAENSVVNRDLDLYAKYNSNSIVPYTIRYVFKDENGNEVKVADDTKSSGLIDSTATASAKTGAELYPAYQEGYFPVLRSSSITLNKSDEVLTFYYVQADKVPVTVRYQDEEGNNLIPPYKYDSSKAVVTEYAKEIQDYVADSYSKTLVLTYSEDGSAKNEIIFTYTKDDAHAWFNVEHYLDSDLKNPYTTLPQKLSIGDLCTANPLTFNDYRLDYVLVNRGNGDERIEGKDWKDQKYELTKDNLTIKFYYYGIYRVVVQNVNTVDEPFERRTLKEQDDHDLTNLVKDTMLYGGLYTDDSYTTPYTKEIGKDINPVTGRTYYVKTVDRKYLWPALYAVYNRNSNKIDKLHAVTATDDERYRCVGYGQQHEYGSEHSDLYQSFEVHRISAVAGENGETTYQTTVEDNTAQQFFKLNGLLACERIMTREDINDSGDTSITLRPYFVTPDGVRVDSRLERTFTIHDGKFENVGIQNETFVGNTVITSVAGSTGKYIAKAPAKNYVVRTGDIDEDTPEVPEEPKKVKVQMVTEGSENTLELDKGNVRDLVKAPEVDGMYFAGWYSDAEYNNPANLTDVQEDITIYGKYIESRSVAVDLTTTSSFLSSDTKVKASIEFTENLPLDLTATLLIGNKEYSFNLTKKSVEKGNIFDLIFGSTKTVWEYSGTANLGRLSGTQTAELKVSWITEDGTVVTIPSQYYQISRNRIQ